MSQQSWKPEVFDRLYASNPDPWGFETSDYERAKYADTLAQLDDRRFKSGLELGCSIGVLSRLLARQCDHLLGLDAAEAALEQARRRCRELDHVRFSRALLPADWPEGAFDLILISEMLYFLSPHDIERLARRCAQASLPGGIILLVNWTGRTNTPTTGDQAATLFRAHVVAGAGAGAGAGAKVGAGEFMPDAPRHRTGYRLDRVHRVGAPQGQNEAART